MPLYRAISILKQTAPLSEQKAQEFLDELPANLQAQIICAIYIGRDHIHNSELRTDLEISVEATNHISKADYARIIYEKNSTIITYLDALERCAKKSNFNLNNL